MFDVFWPRFDCSSNQLRELPSSLGGCLALSDLKVMLNHDLLMNRCADLFSFFSMRILAIFIVVKFELERLA